MCARFLALYGLFSRLGAARAAARQSLTRAGVTPSPRFFLTPRGVFDGLCGWRVSSAFAGEAPFSASLLPPSAAKGDPQLRGPVEKGTRKGGPAAKGLPAGGPKKGNRQKIFLVKKEDPRYASRRGTKNGNPIPTPNERETVMDKSEIRSGYEITASGTFFAAQDRNKVLRTWGPETFFLPEFSTIKTGFKWQETKRGDIVIKRAVPKIEKVNSLAWASHLIQRYYLPARLAAKHKDFVRFRTCVITNTKRVTKEIAVSSDLREENIPTMTLEQLRTLCAISAVAIPLDDFADIAEARKAVQDELQNIKLAQRKKSSSPALEPNEEPEAEPESQSEAPETEEYGEGTIQTSAVDPDEENLFK